MGERAPWAPHRSETEERRRLCELLYDLQIEFRRQSFLADPALVYDDEHDFCRFRDGKFAFSREHANWGLLRKRGKLKGLE